MIPQAGSAYAYSYATLGELVAWIIGWDLILEYAVGNVAVAISWGDYFKTLLRGFGIALPAWLTTGYRTALLSPDPAVHGLLESAPHIAGIPILVNVPAFAHRDADHLAAAARRARERHAPTTSWSSIKLLALALFVVVGAHAHQPGELPPVRAERLHRHPPGRGDRLLRLHRLRRDLDGGRGDARTRSATCRSASSAGWRSARVIYVIVGAVLTGMVPYQELGASPIRWPARSSWPGCTTRRLDRGARRGGLDVGRAAGVPVRPAAHLLRDGARRPAAEVGGAAPPEHAHPVRDDAPHRRRSWRSWSLVGDAGETYDLTNIGTLFAFVLVCIGVLVLRYRAGPAAAVPRAVASGRSRLSARRPACSS